MTQARRIARHMPIGREGLRRGIEAAEAAPKGSDPERAIVGLMKTPYVIMTQARRIARHMVIDLERPRRRIEAVEAVIGSDPERAVVGLK